MTEEQVQSTLRHAKGLFPNITAEQLGVLGTIVAPISYVQAKALLDEQVWTNEFFSIPQAKKVADGYAKTNEPAGPLLPVDERTLKAQQEMKRAEAEREAVDRYVESLSDEELEAEAADAIEQLPAFVQVIVRGRAARDSATIKALIYSRTMPPGIVGTGADGAHAELSTVAAGGLPLWPDGPGTGRGPSPDRNGPGECPQWQYPQRPVRARQADACDGSKRPAR